MIKQKGRCKMQKVSQRTLWICQKYQVGPNRPNIDLEIVFFCPILLVPSLQTTLRL